MCDINDGDRTTAGKTAVLPETLSAETAWFI